MAMQCRCCLSTKATEFVDMASSTTDQQDFFHCFNVCTQLEARVDDVLPGMLCGSCCYDLQVAYHFVQVARQGDATLRESMLLKQKHWEESPTMTEIVEVETAEAEAEMDRLEYVNGSETEECVVEELLEEDEDGPLMQVELMEVEAVEEESLDEVGYMDVKPSLGDLDETTPAPQNDVTIKQEQIVCCAEDEADDEYLIEYNAEEATAVRDAATASGAKWKCVQCKRVLRGDVSYEGHMNMHRDMRPYSCWQCSCAFRCKNALTRHTEQRHNTEALPPQLGCELCHLRFAQESELQQHQQLEHTSQNRCEKCPKTLESAVALAEHNELTHGTSSIVECRFCSQMTTLPRAKIAEHYRNAHPAEHRRYFPTAGRPVVEPAKPTPWQCDICKRYMRSDSALRDHRNTHLNERPHSCQCCSKRFATSNNLRQHMRSVHPEEYEKLISEAGDIVVQCEVCKKQLLRRNLEKHVALHEKKKREASEAQTKFLCAYCSRECKNQKSLSQHEKMHESESPDVTYICADCDRSYATQHLLQQHRKQAHKERDNFCPICGNAFKLRNQLLNHMKLHLEKNIQCPQCDKRYARKFDLDVHMRSHTGEMPYACHLCEKRFAIKVRLTYHLQKHYGIKHRCKECGAEFNSKQKLKAHSYKHTGMPYRCETCDGHGFTNRDAFKRHLLRVHGVTMTEEALLEMFQQNTGKSTRIRPIDELENVMIRTSQVETASTTATITEVLINAEDIGMATEVVHANSIHSIQIVETKVALYFQLCGLFAAQEFSQSKYLSLHEQNAACHKQSNQQPHLDENVPRAHSPASRSGGDGGKECQVCGNTFKTAAHLWAHKLLHKEKRYVCGCCDKKYTRRADLRVHMRSHTGEMPYSCQLCEKRFPIRGQLTYHLQRHRGVTHVCAYCGANYDNRSTLKEHLFKHTGMPYRCELCSGVGFTRRLRFANHMQRAHNQTLSEDELAQVFAKYTGKAVRFKVIDGSGTECDDSQDSQYHESAATAATDRQ